MEVLISRLHHPVTALGPGRRAGIWLQGCSIRCRGCVSVDTWEPDGRAAVPVGDVLGWLAGLPAGEVDGVTISGGEPTDQPAALAELLSGIQAWRAARPPELPAADVLLFTGRSPSWVERSAPECLAGVDAVVAGPYVAGRAGSSPLRGSENQRLIAVTPLGQQRLAEYQASVRARMQVEVTGEGVWMIGIPLPGDMAAFQAATAARGVSFPEPSWLS
ncbi:MAG: 4Fe-4S cluster-binding domain-containing protein [Pseudonocardiaceae bacterium]